MDQIHSAMVMLKVYLFKKSEITKLNYSKLNDGTICLTFL